MPKKIVLLCSDCFSTVVIYNYISKFYPISEIITEDPMRGLALAKRRIKKLGFFRVAGQVAFSVMIVPLLKIGRKKRISFISKKYQFDEAKLTADKITHFNSVNDPACIAKLKECKPDIVLVNGTRILSSNLLDSIPAIFINMHAGITPQYRGVHGGYWALAKNDPDNCGVTVHLVDKGIDTGGILFQSRITTTKQDNFITYPFLQIGEGLQLMKKAIEAAEQNNLHPLEKNSDKGRLWYHPTIWQYLWLRIIKGKK
jgi:methionyl-tRNA formyltransferase